MSKRNDYFGNKILSDIFVHLTHMHSRLVDYFSWIIDVTVSVFILLLKLIPNAFAAFFSFSFFFFFFFFFFLNPWPYEPLRSVIFFHRSLSVANRTVSDIVCSNQLLKWFYEAGRAHLTKPGWSKPHTHSNPTNLALFRHKITLYRFNQGGSYYCRGLKYEQGAEPPSPLTLTTGSNTNPWCRRSSTGWIAVNHSKHDDHLY